MTDSQKRVEAALRPWGWTVSPEFWDRYHQDAWVFNLVNALTRVTADNTAWAIRWQEQFNRAERAETRVTELETAAREVIREWDAGGEWIRESFERVLDCLRALVPADQEPDQ